MNDVLGSAVLARQIDKGVFFLIVDIIAIPDHDLEISASAAAVDGAFYV